MQFVCKEEQVEIITPQHSAMCVLLIRLV